MTQAVATLAGGCFWCIEAVFNRLRGVESALSGYMGGPSPNPTYKQVCTGTTGHAEVVQICFDPAVMGFESLLQVFFAIHDPTTLNRQGEDVGTQYRSAVFFHNAQQQHLAKKALADLAAQGIRAVTEITPATTFYPAETYHQGYFNANPQQGYCRMVVGPKIAKAMKQFAPLLKNAAG